MNTSPFHKLRSLIADGTIQTVVDRLGKDGGLSIAIFVDNDLRVFASKHHPLSAETRVDIGCLTRNLTSVLTAYAVSDGHIRYRDNVATYFPEHVGIDPELRISHLIGHSHGLDGSFFESMPITKDGYIDTTSIWRQVGSTPPIASPGMMFYYWGSVGHWIAAAILERIYGLTLAELLKSRILDRLDISERARDPGPLCPASGGVELSAKELLGLCRIHLRHLRLSDHSDPIHMLGARCDLKLPDWPPVGEGIALGWFHYSGRTLGISGTHATILVSPDENAAIALTGDALHIARRELFGPLIVGENAQRPKLLDARDRETLPMERFLGVYRKASLSLEIHLGMKGELRGHLYKRSLARGYEQTPFVKRSLHPGTGDIFFPTAPELLAIPFIHFDQLREDGRFQYASTSLHVFRLHA